MNESYVTVYFDDASDVSGWVVDRCDADEVSTTVRWFFSEHNARKFAQRYSKQTGLPIRN